MPNYAISATKLNEGSMVMIRGQIQFSRLTRLIDGEELVKVNERKTKNGMNPVNQPHTSITISKPEVLYADPDNPTQEEQFVAERCYTSRTRPQEGLQYSIDSKGSDLPIIAIPNPEQAGTFIQDTSGRELANGLNVTLVLRVYKPKNFANRGLAVDQVVVNETPRYYTPVGAANLDELAKRGIVFAAPPVPVSTTNANPVGQAAPVDSDSQDSDSQDTELPMPTPQAAPVPQVQAQPQQAQVQAPQQQQQAADSDQAESLKQKLARLEAENKALAAGAAAGSPVGAPVAGPWEENSQQAGITYQG